MGQVSEGGLEHPFKGNSRIGDSHPRRDTVLPAEAELPRAVTRYEDQNRIICASCGGSVGPKG